MKMKKSTILILSSMTLGALAGIGSSLNSKGLNAAYSAGVTVSEDGKTKTINPASLEFHDTGSSSLTESSGVYSVAKNKYYYDKDDGILYHALAKNNWSPSTDKFKNVDIYFQVPQNSTGSVSINSTGSNAERFMYYIKDGMADTAGVSFPFDKKTNTQSYTSEHISALQFDDNDNYVESGGTKTRYFVGLSTGGTDYKADKFEITLDSGNFNHLEAAVYTVTYKSGQFTIGTEAVEENKYPTNVPSVTSEEGKKFKGWSKTSTGEEIVDPASVQITEDTTFYAIFEDVQTHNVTFNENYSGGKTEVKKVNDQETASSLNYTPKRDPDEAGAWVFLGWYKEAEGTNEYTFEEPVTQDIELFAKWEHREFVKVTFKVNEEPYGNEVKVVKGEAFDETYGTWPDDPTMPHKTFVGWYDADEQNKYDQQSTFNESIELHAKFEDMLVETFEFSNYLSSPYTDAETTWIVEDYFGYYGFGKASGTYAQAKGLRVKMKSDGKITINLQQTGKNKNRKIYVLDVASGLHYATELEPDEANKALTDIELLLPEGEYIIGGYEYGSAASAFGEKSAAQFNFNTIKFDYTANPSFESTLKNLTAMGLYTQTGANAEGGKAMRFVGALQNVLVDNIKSIHLEISATKTVEVEQEQGPVAPVDEAIDPSVPTVPSTEYKVTSLMSDYIYSVYDHVSEGQDTRFVATEGRLYFYYIVDENDIKDLENVGTFETLKSINCTATVMKSDGTSFVLETSLNCSEAFVS